MTEAEYAALPGVRWSRLRHMATSAMHYRWALDHPRPETKALRLGRAIHCAILEPAWFTTRWHLFDGDKRKKEWKLFKAEHAEDAILSRAENAFVHGCARAVRAHPLAMKHLDGAREKTVTWKDGHTGLQCKARCDLVTDRRLVELKSTARLDHSAFVSTTARLGYHGGLAFHLDGVRGSGGSGVLVEPEPIVIAVESIPPHDVVVYEVPAVVVDLGRREYQNLLERLAECTMNNRWPGRAPDRMLQLELPEWAYGGFDDGLVEVNGDEEEF